MRGRLVDRAGREEAQPDGLLEEARLLGVPPERLAHLAAAADRVSGLAEAGGVWPVNITIVTAWLSIASQWRTETVSDRGRMRIAWLGLDYAGARVALDAREIVVTPELWDGLCLMEMAAREDLNR